MRFKLSTLLLVLVSLGAGTASLISLRPVPRYNGYFASHSTMDLIRDVDPGLQIIPVSGGNTYRPDQFMSLYLRRLRSSGPISADFVRTLQKRLLDLLAAQGIQATSDVFTSNLESPWGFLVRFEEGGYRGALTFRLILPRPALDPVPGTVDDQNDSLAELFENVVVFPKN